MQAVILAAGKSSRLYPFNSSHKSLISILGEPIISHTVRSIKRAGITDIILVTGSNNLFKDILGNGKKFGVKITYVIQEKPTGMGDALLAASRFIKSDFFLAHAHRVEFNELKSELDKKRQTNKNAVILAQEEENISAYGSLIIEGDNVVGLIEKPKKGKAPSNLKIIGIYFLNSEYLKILKDTKPHQYSFETALDKFARENKVKVVITHKDAVTFKYPWDLLQIKNYLLKKIKKHFSKKAKISTTAKIEGEVFIEDGAIISEYAVIKGPSYIGKDSFVGTSSLIRNGTDIEDGVKIGAYAEIKNSLIFQGSSTHSGFIGDSVIGKNCKIGASFTTANVRLDRTNIRVRIKEDKVETNFKYMGAMVGDNTIVGSRVTIMPGIIVGNNVNIGPSTTVMKNVDSDISYYTKFQEVVSKKNLSKNRINE